MAQNRHTIQADEESGRPAPQSLTSVFQKAASAAAPAPERSLVWPQARAVAKDAFAENSTLYFGETHDDVNLKFLADNPDFFAEAAAQKGRYVFIEIPILLGPLLQDYYDDKISKAELEKAIVVRPTSGDNPENYAKYLANLSETVKNQGMRLIASDFRDLRRVVGLSSDAFGIPDITGVSPESQRQTRISLEQFQAKTGLDFPRTNEHIVDFAKMHLQRMMEKLLHGGAAEAETFHRCLQELNAVWPQDKHSVQSNDQLQFNYYSRLVEPGEKSIFFGGSSHFYMENTLDNHIRDNGYGNVAGIRLLSEAGRISDMKLETGQHSYQPDYKDPFMHTILTEDSKILNHNGAELPSLAQTPEDMSQAQDFAALPAAVQPEKPRLQPGLTP